MPSINDYLSLDTAAAANSLSVTMRKEKKNLRYDYINQSSSSSSDKVVVTESDRMVIVDWCYIFIDTFQFNRETLAKTMEVVDRFLSNPKIPSQKYLSDCNQYQLLILAALYISIKINELIPCGSDIFAEISDDNYSVEEIEDMELTILQGLDWHINSSTSLQIAYHILSVTSPGANIDVTQWEFILDEVQYQCEYAVRDFYFSTRPPSTAAAAAILNACDQLDCQVYKDIVGDFLFTMDDIFASPRDLFSAQKRLQCLIDDDSPDEEDTT